MTAEIAGEPEPSANGRQGGVGDIDNSLVGSIVTDPHAPTHTGTGAQLVNSTLSGINNAHVEKQYVMIAAAAATQRSLRLEAAANEIESLRAAFVRPDGFELLQSRLDSPGSSLVLTGPPGSGRRAAAKMLLCPSAGTTGALRLLSTADFTEADPLSPEDVSEGDRLLLDVSDVEEVSAFHAVQHDLLRCVGIAERRKARLVILIAPHRESMVHDDLMRLIGRIRPPDRWQVLGAHLRIFGLPAPRRHQVDDADLMALEHLSMSGVARVATLLRQARDLDSDGDFRAWFSSAISATADHSEAVATLVGKLETVQERTLLLAAAMAEHSKLDAVFAAERRLHDLLGYQVPVELHRIAEPGITDRLRQLECLELYDAGYVRFRQLAFGQAVLTYFWDAYPDLRRVFADWVRLVTDWRAATTRNRADVMWRFSEQVARTNSLSDLYRLVEDWSERGQDELRILATRVLGAVLVDERTADSVRRRLYWWSRTKGLSPGLGGVLVSVCYTELAVGHPKQALIRLRWLSDHSSPTGEKARTAIAGLCEDNRTLEQFLAVLTDRDRFDAGLCRSIINPRRLSGLPGEPSPLLIRRLADKSAEALRRALANLTADEWISAVTPWLGQHAMALVDDESEIAESLLSVLLQLCDQQVELLARLYAANRAWLRSGDVTGLRRTAAAIVEDAVRMNLAEKPAEERSSEGELR